MPDNIILDSYKEQTLANFRTKFGEIECHVKLVEHRLSWFNSYVGVGGINMVIQASGIDLQ